MRNYVIGFALIAGAANMGWFGGTGTGGTDKPAAIPPAAPGAKESDPRRMGKNVIAYHTGDDDMNKAKAKARKTLPRFLELIEKKTPGTYTVKFPLTQNGETEHIWMQLTGHKGGTFKGRLANKPVNGNKYRMGDAVEVAKADVEDWMVNTGSEMYGGYTVRVMLSQMPKDEAAKLRAMMRD